MNICNKKECTGCMACFNICPADAISITEDSRGFYIPKINSEQCTQCLQCKKICPNNSLLEKERISPQVYAAWAKSEEIRNKSTSGGIFTGVANWILHQGGTVFGAVVDKNNNVRHISIQTTKELNRMRGSKYVQSFIGEAFKEVREKLEKNKMVLFTGTPCQVAGLYQFLQKDYSNLYTLDIICHGVPSPKIFSEYTKYMEAKENSNIEEISFRMKKPSWTVFSMYIKFRNKRIYRKDTFHDPYLVAFLSDYISRDCCHQCKYTNEQRVGDITIADFWSYVSYTKEEKNDEKGISLVILNTEKGRDMFTEIKSDYIVFERTMKEAKRGNRCLSKPYGKAKMREAFWNHYNNGYSFIECAKKYCPSKKRGIKHSISNNLNRYYYLLPHILKTGLERYFS